MSTKSRWERKPLTSPAAIALLAMLALAGVSAAGVPDDIDLVVGRDAGGGIVATCYRGSLPATRYVLAATDVLTRQSREFEINAGEQLALSSLDPRAHYEFVVSAYDSADLVGVSPTESDLAESPSFDAPAADRAIGLSITSLDPGNFPFIFSNVELADVPAGCTPVEADFTVHEDGVLQTDYFEVTPIGVSGNRLLDMVFLVDCSGSMDDEQNAVRQNLSNFATALANAGVDFRLGLVKFGQSSGSGNPVPVNGGTMTDDDQDFISHYLNQLEVSGSREPGLEAVISACQNYPYRPGSLRLFLLITDEDSDGGNLTTACSLCNGLGVKVMVAVNSSGYYDYSGPGSIRDCTGGEQYPVAGPYDQILDYILQFTLRQYVVRYRTTNDTLDGLERLVRISVNACTESSFDEATYTPGTAPTIVRTPETISLSDDQQPQLIPLHIECVVTDNYPPPVNSVLLRYRATGNTAYQQLAMNPLGGGHWAADIPAAGVMSPGVDYYIQASDGTITVTDPRIDANAAPYQIAVSPNFAPEILVLNPVNSHLVGTDLVITAIVTDHTNYLSEVVFSYREVGDLLYTNTVMTGIDSLHTGIVPASALDVDTDIEFMIRATDDYGVSSVYGPHYVDIIDFTPPLDCVWEDATIGPLGDTGDGHGVSWGDFDNDGDDDLFLANNGISKLLRNDGNGTFFRLDEQFGDAADARLGCWGDCDNDGDLDLYLVNYGSPNHLFRNDGGVFSDVTAGPLGDADNNTSGAWADWDLDGDVDLFLTCDDGRSKLLRNDGGVFVDLVGDPASFHGWSRGCAFGDYDNDGDPDLYVTIKDGANKLFRNDREGGFVEATPSPLDDSGSGKGCAWGDYDNDGWLDLYVVNKDGANKLFHNLQGSFVDVTDGTTGDEGDGRTCAWGDYNRDGWLDLFITNVDGANKLFHNLHGTGFADSTCGALNAPELTAWGAAFSDYDNDGDIDLYVSNHTWTGVPNRMFRNQLIGGSWLAVGLIGTSSNHFGIGARIEVTADGTSQVREISPSGYLSQSSLVAQFGLGSAHNAVVKVTWPTGRVQTIPVDALNNRITVTENSTTGAGDLPTVSDLQIRNHPNPFNPMTTISFAVSDAAAVRLRVFDVSGRLVRVLVDNRQYGAGVHQAVWNGRTDDGSEAPSGLYFCRLEVGSRQATHRMTLIK